MKHIIFFSSVILIFSVLSCSQEEPTSPTQTNHEIGKLFLMIDKENAPSDVMEVIAVLSREGFDTLADSMNLLSGSSAEILFEDIHAGTWHLKVDAVDSLDVVLYTGATEVLITAGFTTQVSLVLEPTGAGTGNVYIFVTWGQYQAIGTTFLGILFYFLPEVFTIHTELDSQMLFSQIEIIRCGM